MFVPRFTMFVSSVGMLFRLFFLAKLVMMGGLVMMMGGSVMVSGGLKMMLTGRMFGRLCHVVFLHNQPMKRIAGCSTHIESIS